MYRTSDILRLLSIMAEDGSQSPNAIADAHRHESWCPTAKTIREKLTELSNAGIVEAITVRLGYREMGVHSSLLLLRSAGGSGRGQLVDYLRSNVHVFEIQVCNGAYDLVVVLRSPSATDKLAFIESLLLRGDIQDYQVLECVNSVNLESERLGDLAGQPRLYDRIEVQ